ncbi:unnamed protein product, partial [Rotaria magnacalcarata]
ESSATLPACVPITNNHLELLSEIGKAMTHGIVHKCFSISLDQPFVACDFEHVYLVEYQILRQRLQLGGIR